MLIGFAAVNTGNNLLFLVVSSLLAFMAVSGLAGWLNLRGLQVVPVFPDELYDGAQSLITVQVENRKKRLPSFLVRVHLSKLSVTFPVVAAGETVHEVSTVCLAGRGRKMVSAVRVSSPYPINFFVRWRTVPATGRYVVFPAPRRCPGGVGSDRSVARGEAMSARRGTDGDLATIREYTGSEPMKLIHWRHSARHTGLKVKDLTAQTAVPLTVNVQELPGSLEERLSYAVYLVNDAIRAGRPVGLQLGASTIAPDCSRSHRLRLLEELATYGAD